MTMSYVSQQNPAPIHQPFHEVSGQKDEYASTVSPKFDSRNVSAKDIGEFLGSKEYTEVLELTRDMGNKAKEVRKGDWVIKNLETEFKKHDLPLDRTGHKALKHDKDKAVLNIMLGVKAETNNGASSDPSKPSLGDRFCAWIRDPTSVYAGGQQALLAEMNKDAAMQPPGLQHVSSDTVGAEYAMRKEAEMSERDIRPETVHSPYFDGKQPSSVPVSAATAPPPYVDSQNTQTILDERAKLSHIALRLGQCQQGNLENLEISFFESELSRINGVIQQLGRTGTSLQAELNNLQAECIRVQSQLDAYKLGKCERELKELRSSLGGIDVEKENSGRIEDIESQLKALSSQVGSLASTKESQVLQERIKTVLAKDIDAWKDGVAATDVVEEMKQDILLFEVRKSTESVNAFSERLTKLLLSIEDLPVGKHRTSLFSSVKDELKKPFAAIQDKFRAQQVQDGFTEVKAKIDLLPGCRSEDDKQRLLEKAETALTNVRSILEQQKGGANSEHLETLRLLNGKVGELRSKVDTMPTTAAKIQSAAQGQVEELVASIDDLIAEADNRLSGAEKMRKAVAGTPLNQTHMDEIKGFLDQINEKILQVKGLDHRAERDRLQTMNANLLSRLTQLEGGGANSGQSTAASTQPESGNQNQTDVEKVRQALHAVKAQIEALESNPKCPNKSDLRTKAEGGLASATLMLSKIVDPELEHLRLQLNTELKNLTHRLEALEMGDNQGQGLNDINVLQLNRTFLRKIADNLRSGDIHSLMFLTNIPNQHREQIERSAGNGIELLEYLESRVNVAKMIELMEVIGRCDIARKIREYQDSSLLPAN